jgi:anti-sigma B factor antagonist
MSLSIETRKNEHVIVLELAGRLSVLESRLKEIVEQLLEAGERYFLINLGNVSYMDNSGLGQLCLIYTLAKKRGGEMKLLKPTPRILKLLNITKLDTVFQSFDKESDAIESLQLLTSASVSA